MQNHKMLSFVAVDVETANEDLASICQVGVAKFVEAELIDEWVSLIDPEDFCSGFKTSIHGIAEADVAGAPNFPAVANRLVDFLDGNVCVCHTHFDRLSLARVCAKYGLPEFETTWLDSARVARRTWLDCAWKGYGLLDLCKRIGYEFRHHHALEDAKAAAQVLLAAMRETGLGVEDWLARVKQPIDPSRSSTKNFIKREGCPEGCFYGDVIVFTGALRVVRSEAADIAAEVGFRVETNVTKRTTMLVVGDHDIRKLAGNEKSRKHRRAEELIADGQGIRILQESDFLELVKIALSSN